MSLLVCNNRAQLDKYSSAKSIGQFSLAASLIADDIKDLYDSVMKGPDNVKYFWALVIVIGISLILQLIATIFSVILYFKRYPKRVKGPQDGGQQVEMTPTPGNDNDSTVPSEGGDSTDKIGVHFEGTPDFVDPLPPIVMRRLNDGLTVITLLVGILHLLKNGLHSNII
ncbi:hypothetical protein LSH36_601g01101 [Paralvinella palmiformis]|uniref:Uncharacterized protein n=1 Tax=Paralvinella palmiformis TaxID=53620 RepID=A0AAD9MWM6_9ANNE|nr:hypothetical protein LSH36_601g01101 [Paralvinella palmiformis]